MTIGFAVNPAVAGSDDPINSEYASDSTIQGITNAIEEADCSVIQIDAGMDVFEELSRLKNDLDMVLNIAEGTPGMGSRKTAVAGMLEHLGIPYTGSDIHALTVGNDKALARSVLSGKVPNPKWRRFDRHDEHVNGTLDYPLFVKPATEGSSVGIEQDCVVYSEPELRRALSRVINELGKPAIAESFLDGNEYNIGIIGDLIFPALEWDLGSLPGSPKVRDPSVKDIDIGYCEPVGSSAVFNMLANHAAVAHQCVGARDYSRSDFRSGKGAPGEPNFLEINMMPGLDPEKSDLPRAAALAGAKYGDVVRSVVHSALSRLIADDRYCDSLSGKETGGFRQSYDALVNLASGSEPISVGGKTYHVLRPLCGLA